MKNKTYFLGILAILLVFAMTAVGCDLFNKNDGGNILNGTTWRATNSDGYYYVVTFNSSTNWSMEDNINNGQIATHTGTYTVSGNTVTLTTLTFNGSASSGTQTGTISGNTISVVGWPTFTKQ